MRQLIFAARDSPQEALRFTEQLAALCERHCSALRDFTGACAALQLLPSMPPRESRVEDLWRPLLHHTSAIMLNGTAL